MGYQNASKCIYDPLKADDKILLLKTTNLLKQVIKISRWKMWALYSFHGKFCIFFGKNKTLSFFREIGNLEINITFNIHTSEIPNLRKRIYI